MRLPRSKDVRRFCVVDGWQSAADRPGRRVSKHELWEKTLASGETLRTVISKGRGQYTTSLFDAVLKRQLRVSEAEFWRAVDKGVPPARPEAQPNRPAGALLPFGLVEELLKRGHSLDEVRGMSLEQAQRLARDSEGDDGDPSPDSPR